jgi:hypothetical protein
MLTANSEIKINCKVFRPRESDKGCPVDYFWDLFQNSETSNFYLIKIAPKTLIRFPKIFYDSYKKSELPKRILLFAHEIEPVWWKETTESYEMLVAHVCEGSTELSDNLDIPFKDWVSYSECLFMIWGHPVLDFFWKKLFISVSDIIREIPKDSNLIKERIKKLYQEELNNLDEGNPIDSIIMGCLSQWQDCIVSKN